MQKIVLLAIFLLGLAGCTSSSSDITVDRPDYRVSEGAVEWDEHVLYSGYEGILSLLLWNDTFAFQYSGLEIGGSQGQVRFNDLSGRIESEDSMQYSLQGSYNQNIEITQTLRPTERGVKVRLEWSGTFPVELDYANLAFHLNAQLTMGKEYQINDSSYPYPQAQGTMFLEQNLSSFQISSELPVQFYSTSPISLVDARLWGGEGFDLLINLRENSSPVEVEIILPRGTSTVDNAELYQLRHSAIGYASLSDKAAFLEWPVEANGPEESWVELIDESGQVILQGNWASPRNQWQFTYALFDFSSVTQTGNYRIRWAGGASEPFPIGNEIFNNIWQDALDNYIPWQMCHAEVHPGGNAPSHGACHLDDGKGVDPQAKEVDGFFAMSWPNTELIAGEDWDCAVGGWHDAGDYDLHLAAQSMTVHHLALTFEEFNLTYDNASLDYQQGIYRGNQMDGIPDVLQQCLWGSLWLLSMQQSDGRFYQGVIAEEEQYLAHVAPEESSDGIRASGDERNVYCDYQSSEQLKAVIALAAASRVLKAYYPQIAQQCLQSALLGYQYFKSEVPSWHNQTAFLIQEPSPFGEVQSQVSAAAELYLTTQDNSYLFDMEQHMPMVLQTPHYWPHPDYSMRMNHIFAGPYLARVYAVINNEGLKSDIYDFLLDNMNTKLYLFDYGAWPYPSMANPWYGMNQFAIRNVYDYYYVDQVLKRENGLLDTLPLFYWLTGLHPLDNNSYIIGIADQQPERIFGKQLVELYGGAPYAIDGSVAPGLCTQGDKLYFNQTAFSFQCIEPVIDVSATLIFASLALEESLQGNP